MVLAWTGMSYAVPSKVPHAVPRRLICPFPWDKASLYHWTVIMVLVFSSMSDFLGIYYEWFIWRPVKA